ncbi:uncharacterized protein LOC143851844 [Tasmannia lanceolata]|uniref:uncharacterized protein LOC143851844 n=1 Tax=Tasmannia lanceolata TaxID=3420 RepID=UPI004063B963
MSWLARSIANSLKLDNEEDEEEDENREKPHNNSEESSNPFESETPNRGVKEDLSELTKTLTRQLWGVASFLTPPPSSPSSSNSPLKSSLNPSISKESDPEISESDPEITDSPRIARIRSDFAEIGGGFSDPSVSKESDPKIIDSPRIGRIRSDFAEIGGRFSDPSVSKESDPKITDSPRIGGIRSDFAEIGDRFKSGISRFSTNKAVSEISKIASSFLPFGSEEEGLGDAVGVTDEVLAFARNISMHPETWLDFPLFVDDEDSDDFDMSDAQQEHALAVERLASRLAALRIELCPSHMSEGCFWKIYFVLLHSRLNKHDAELLATPQIVEARAMLLQELQDRTKRDPERSGRSTSFTRDAPQEQLNTSYISSETAPIRTFPFEPMSASVSTTDFETIKHPVVTTEMRFIDKSVVEEGPTNQTKNLPINVSSEEVMEDEGDDWLHEDHSEMTSASIPLGNEDDVSFSDLEDDDDVSKTVTDASDSSTKDSRGWVQLGKSSSRNSERDSHSDNPRNQKPRHSNSDTETKDSTDWLSVDEIDAL